MAYEVTKDNFDPEKIYRLKVVDSSDIESGYKKGDLVTGAMHYPYEGTSIPYMCHYPLRSEEDEKPKCIALWQLELYSGPIPYSGGVGAADVTQKNFDVTCDSPVPNPSSISSMLEERGKRYGSFTTHAEIAQKLKDIIASYPVNPSFRPDQREALDMICHKIARIINGDPNYIDSWQDIAGYAQLIVNRLENSDD